MTESEGLSALDYAEIHNLYAFYNLSSDSGAPEDYASCFTEDGEMIVAQRGLIAKGRADLVTYKRNDQASRGGR
ncbi:MAG: nuclear transport factor 2 family protein, partial [Dehalococcoidia bacterium]|nr:nuclear transport factor 2 family protein [Dehalococcoidia bacterium]